MTKLRWDRPIFQVMDERAKYGPPHQPRYGKIPPQQTRHCTCSSCGSPISNRAANNTGRCGECNNALVHRNAVARRLRDQTSS